MRSLISSLWAKCFAPQPQEPLRSRSYPTSLRMEALEKRDCPAKIDLYGNLLVIDGSNFSDTSNVWIGNNGTPSNPYDDVLVANLWYTDTNHAYPIPVSIQKVYSVQGVTDVQFEGLDGNDRFDNYTALQGVWIAGGNGNDTINGGSGRDFIVGENGNDILSGGAGNDLIYGGSGNDYLDGWTGNDEVYGGAGSDVLYGWTGNDTLNGEAGSDTLYGEDGNDTLYGGYVWGAGSGDLARDYLSGGAGADTFAAEWYWDVWAALYFNRDNPSDFNAAAGDRFI